MNINFDKFNGLVPAIIQDNYTKNILMLGFMNKEALKKTIDTKLVTFYSRTKKRLWTKGEESGNYLNLVDVISDCDNDTLLLTVNPQGNVCHTGNATCFSSDNKAGIHFLLKLEEIIKTRKNNPLQNSYTSKLFAEGIDRIAQKVGEEAVETIIASKNTNDTDFINEVSDLMYHLIVLLQQKNINFLSVIDNLENRNKKN